MDSADIEKIASECFEAYRKRYHEDNKVLVPPWSELPWDVRRRWLIALRPVTDRIEAAESTFQGHNRLKENYRRLVDDENSAYAQLRELRAALNDADLQVLDGIALQHVPPAMVQLMEKLAGFMGRSEPVKVRVWTGTSDDAADASEEAP